MLQTTLSLYYSVSTPFVGEHLTNLLTPINGFSCDIHNTILLIIWDTEKISIGADNVFLKEIEEARLQ